MTYASFIAWPEVRDWVERTGPGSRPMQVGMFD